MGVRGISKVVVEDGTPTIQGLLELLCENPDLGSHRRTVW